MVRGTVVLPHGTGKTKRVLVVAAGEKAKEAEAAGADHVGGPEIVVATDGAVVATESGDGRNGVAGRELVLSAGDAVWAPADTGSYQLTGTGTVFRCSVGGAFT